MLGTSVHADDKAVLASLKGTYAWDYMKPKASKCTKTTPALITKMKKYVCEVPAKGTTASGKDAVASCRTKDEADGFVFFTKLEDCKAERETQLANGA
ncbi:MAG: hypothetical protein ABI175_14985 [Polyangiales bacterium]